jgi:hypothetical protein
MVETTRTLDEDNARRAVWERAVGIGIVVVATWFVLLIMNPGMHWYPWDIGNWDRGWLLKNTTTNGGDMGAHVYWPWFLEHNWFPKGRLSGWSPAWYAGFPAGHFYFPLPAVAIAILDLIPGMPYNIAFKMVTAAGPLMMPAAAYYFARGIRAPWPAPPAFAIAALGMLFETRNQWQIYGGNIASTLAGEFSFTIGLAIALFALGALGRTLDTGRRPWLPALLIAMAALSHIVVAIFIAIVAALLVLTRRPWKTFPLALAVGGVALALSAVWTLPLGIRHPYTQSMRYNKEYPEGTWELWGWAKAILPAPVEHTVQKFVWAVSSSGTDTGAITDNHHLWLPWWMWALAGVAIVAAGWYRRRSTFVVAAAALIFGVLFIQWPDGMAIWNTRFLPFWLLCWGFVAAMGATELVRLVGLGASWSVHWVREGDLSDARARAWMQLANNAPVGTNGGSAVARAQGLDPAACDTLRVRSDATADEVQRAYRELARKYHPDGFEADAERFRAVSEAHDLLVAQLAARDSEPAPGEVEVYERAEQHDVDPLLHAEALDVVAQQRWDRDPPNWQTPERLDETHTKRRAGLVSAIVVAVVVALSGAYALNTAWDARDNNSGIDIAGWASWNYRGYEQKAAWPEYQSIMQVMGSLPCGRALWEPSSMEGDPINNYGTSLALELLPYYTNGCIGSMEGLYFESSATTSYHFLTVSELAQHPSNPVRGLVWGTLADDFDTGVKHLQMLGVKYYMAWTPEARAKADRNDDLRLVATVPDKDGADPRGWYIYEVQDAPLVEGLATEPVVAELHGGRKSECFGVPPDQDEQQNPHLDAWECSAASWWRNAALLDTMWTASGPKEWQRVDYADLENVDEKRLPAVKVTDIDEQPDKISFHVDKVGVPVVVKTSYFPNWEVSGAKGPYRVAPNLMVVVPTENDVTLNYGLTGVDWLGRLLTLLGIVGLVVLARWKGARRFAADPDPEPAGNAGDDDLDGFDAAWTPLGAEPASGDGEEPHPPDRSEPEPAIP